MKYAIIAAGEGSRLAQEGADAPKPLVKVLGEPLIDRLIRIFSDHQATEICVICNAQMPDVAHHLDDIRRKGLDGRSVSLRYVVKDTPSSMHSLFELSPMLEGDVFCLTTVDTIFRDAEFDGYVEALQRRCTSGEADGLMAVTEYVDDESPLYVGTSDNGCVTGFYDHPIEGIRYVSAGIYGLTRRSLHTLRACVERGERRMRNFQRAMVADGLRLEAYPFGKVFDIDHLTDIAKAEAFLTAEA